MLKRKKIQRVAEIAGGEIRKIAGEKITIISFKQPSFLISLTEKYRALDALDQVYKATEVYQLTLHLTDGNEVVRTVAKRRLQELHKQRGPLWCWIMNKIDFRYWLCDCHYEAPYGKVTSAWCTKHG